MRFRLLPFASTVPWVASGVRTGLSAHLSLDEELQPGKLGQTASADDMPSDAEDFSSRAPSKAARKGKAPKKSPTNGTSSAKGERGLRPTERPHIGILALPANASKTTGLPDKGPVIQTAYERWITSSGGIAVPIDPKSTTEELATLFRQLNGILFTGGPGRRLLPRADGKATEWPEFFHAATHLYHLVVEAAKQGDWVPLWGTCLGFEAIADIAAGGIDILSTFEGVHKVTLPLQWMEGRKSSKIFGSRYFDRNINRAVELLGMNTTSNRHGWGVGVDSFDRHLKNDFLLISLSHDTDAKPFVSTMEHRRAPIYGVQWHPESSSFNNNAWIDRTPADIEAAQWIGRFFVAEARKNEHRPISSLPRLEDFPLTKAGLWKEFYYSLP